MGEVFFLLTRPLMGDPMQPHAVDFWTGIQVHYDTEMAKMNLGNRLEREVIVLVPAA